MPSRLKNLSDEDAPQADLSDFQAAVAAAGQAARRQHGVRGSGPHIVKAGWPLMDTLARAPGKISPELSDNSAASPSTSRARLDNGTRCSRFAFMRSAGSVHVAPSRSISSQVALRTSAERAADRMRNSSASFDERLAFTFGMQSATLDPTIGNLPVSEVTLGRVGDERRR